MNEQTALQTSTRTPTIVLSSQLLVSEARAFVAWWYVEMPTWYITFIKRVILLCDDTLSIQLLLKTFFIPWHRDYSMVGRGFGIALRLLYLPVAIFMTIGIALTLLSLLILWALLPAIAILSILRTPFL